MPMPTPPARTPFVGMLRGVLIFGVGSVLLAAVLGFALREQSGGISATLGAATAFGVLLLGLVGIRMVIAGGSGASLAGAFVVYIGQLVLLAGIILALSGRSWVDGPAFAVATIATTVLIQIGQIGGYVRARHEIYPQGSAA